MTLTGLAASGTQQLLDLLDHRYLNGVLDLAIHCHIGIVITPAPMFGLFSKFGAMQPGMAVFMKIGRD